MIDTSITNVTTIDPDELYKTGPIEASAFVRSVIIRKIESMKKNHERGDLLTCDARIPSEENRFFSVRDNSPGTHLTLPLAGENRVVCIGACTHHSTLNWSLMIGDKYINCRYIGRYKDELNEVLSGLVVI